MRSAALGLFLSFNPHRRSHTARWNREHRSSPEDLRAKVNAQVLEGNPTFFQLEAQLSAAGPYRHADGRLGQDAGRVEDLCGRRRERAASPSERGPHLCRHARRSEVLWAEPRDTTIGKNEGVLFPHGTFYWLKATSDE